MDRPRRCRPRLRVPHEDAPGAARPARVRPRVPGRRTHELGPRAIGLGIAAVSLVVSAGWWVVAVALWPAESRPYIGGSTDNTVLDLVFGYNGLGRILGGSGNGGGMGGGGTAGSSFGGATGLNRLFSSEMGLEISWLLPAALVALVLGLVVVGRQPRRSRTRRSGAVGRWLLVTGLVSRSCPARSTRTTRSRSPPRSPDSSVPWCTALARPRAPHRSPRSRRDGRRDGVLGLVPAEREPVVAAVAALGGARRWAPVRRGDRRRQRPPLRKAVTVGVLAGTLFGLTGTTAYALATTTVAHSGSIPSVGPAGSGSGGAAGFPGGGGGGQPGGAGGPGGSADGSQDGADGTQQGPGSGGQPPTGSAPDGTTGEVPTMPDGFRFRFRTRPPRTALPPAGGRDGRWRCDDDVVRADEAARRLGREVVGRSERLAVGRAARARHRHRRDGHRRLVERPRADPGRVPGLGRGGDIGYYVSSGSGGGGMGGGSSTASAIQEWVAAHYEATTVGGQTVYDLSATT